MSSTTKTVAAIRVCQTCFEKYVAEVAYEHHIQMCPPCLQAMHDRIHGHRPAAPFGSHRP